MNQPIQVLIFEDNKVMRNGLVWLLQSHDQFTCLGAYADANNIKNIISEYTPDIVIMDIQMPGLSGIDALKIIKALKPDVHVVMLTSFEDEDNIFSAIRNGASGYLLKSPVMSDLVRALTEVMDGGSPMNAHVARKVMNYFTRPAQKVSDYNLTSREKEVLALLTEGDSPKMIAKTLFISEQTVGNHIRHIYEKLQVHTRGEVIAKALKEKII